MGAATGGVLRKSCSWKFPKIHRKTPVPRLFFNKTLLKNFIKKESLAQLFSSEFCEIPKNTFLTEHIRTASG